MSAPVAPSRETVGWALQATGLACCPVALAFGQTPNGGPAEWGMLLVAVLFFAGGHSLRQPRATS